MLRRLAVHFNDFFAVMVVLLIVGSWHTLARSGLAAEQVGLVIGAGIVWLGQIVTFYWRKRPDETPPAPRG